MSVTFGFYNSLNGDRTYDATQFSSIFDGLITDGVFASIGTAFAVKAGEANTINVGIGRAWFNRTWTLNDSILPLNVPISEVLLDRIDAAVLEVNTSEAVRANSIKVVKGVPSSQPARPTLMSNESIHQYPFCYIYRKAGSSVISQADITNMVGTVEMPFVTGILQTVSLDELLGQWRAELDTFTENKTNDFNEWFKSIKDVLDENTAGQLLNMITALQDGKANKSVTRTTTLYASTWIGSSSPYTYNLSVSGVTTTSNQELLPSTTITSTQLEALQAANIQDGGQASGKLTLKAWGDKPTVNIPVRVIIRGDA